MSLDFNLALVWNKTRKFLLRFPAVLPLLCIGVFLFIRTAYLAPWARVNMLTPILLLNYVLLHFGYKLIIKRLNLKTLSLWPELLVGVILCGVFFLLDLPVALSWYHIIPLILLVWMILQALAGKIGNFYTAFVGLVMFGAVIFSYRLLDAGERVLLYWTYHKSKQEYQARQVQWSVNASGKVFQLQGQTTRPLNVRLPDGMAFHRVENQKFNHRLPQLGRPLGIISSNALSPMATPMGAFFKLKDDAPLTPGDLREKFEFYLGHRQSINEISGLKFLGHRTLTKPGAFQKLDGLFWTYREVKSRIRRQEGYYFILSPDGEQLAISIQETPLPGLDHHPDILFLLKSMAWLR